MGLRLHDEKSAAQPRMIRCAGKIDCTLPYANPSNRFRRAGFSVENHPFNAKKNVHPAIGAGMFRAIRCARA
ncbi:hypothetical protein [Burkholderia ubonensis]|uniref:hypothetical protein n=1 Tax=Burkholderia ubonensis TaxID=101571 RepID=UPI000AF509F8|nr:hypothetical protein [Burkholderia ubonensis]